MITRAVRERKFTAARAGTWAKYLAEGGDVRVLAEMSAVPTVIPAPTADQMAAVQDALNRHLPVTGTAAAGMPASEVAWRHQNLPQVDDLEYEVYMASMTPAHRDWQREQAAAAAAAVPEDDIYRLLYGSDDD
jgi:hypothetical protein